MRFRLVQPMQDVTDSCSLSQSSIPVMWPAPQPVAETKAGRSNHMELRIIKLLILFRRVPAFQSIRI